MVARSRIDILTDRLADICRRYHVRELSLFGSVLRDDFQADSDVDVLVELEPGARIGLFRFYDLQLDLEQAPGRQIDLVPKRGLKAMIRDEVLASARVVYAA
jgi:predicted nucleotidyltransferase